jgi:hypothetical protein
MTTAYPSQSTASYDSIKLGIDAHAQYYWVSRQVDAANPQPMQKMTYEEVMLFLVKQQKLTRNVVTCYEAGAFGFYSETKAQGTDTPARRSYFCTDGLAQIERPVTLWRHDFPHSRQAIA